MKQLVLLFLFLLSCSNSGFAQNAIVEEALTEVRCESNTHMTTHYKETITILNEQGAHHAFFVCSCSKKDYMTSFRGQVTDQTGKVIRKIKESELERTEYSPYLVVDDYKMYLDYTPPVYPVTITYEWTIDSRDNLITFPCFCPQTDYDVSVRKATYSLKAPKSMTILHAEQNIDNEVSVSEYAKGMLLITLTLNDLPMLKREPYTRPLRERIPLARFAPADFAYYGTQGSQRNWICIPRRVCSFCLS